MLAPRRLRRMLWALSSQAPFSVWNFFDRSCAIGQQSEWEFRHSLRHEAHRALLAIPSGLPTQGWFRLPPLSCCSVLETTLAIEYGASGNEQEIEQPENNEDAQPSELRKLRNGAAYTARNRKTSDRANHKSHAQRRTLDHTTEVVGCPQLISVGVSQRERDRK